MEKEDLKNSTNLLEIKDFHKVDNGELKTTTTSPNLKVVATVSLKEDNKVVDMVDTTMNVMEIIPVGINLVALVEIEEVINPLEKTNKIKEDLEETFELMIHLLIFN